MSYEGNTIEIPFDEYENKDTENSGGSVWEWIDVSLSENRLDFLKQFALSKDAKMRLSGKYTTDKKLTWNERQGIIDVLNGYYALKEGLN